MPVKKNMKIAGLLGLSCVLLFTPVTKGVAQAPPAAASASSLVDAQIQADVT